MKGRRLIATELLEDDRWTAAQLTRVNPRTRKKAASNRAKSKAAKKARKKNR